MPTRHIVAETDSRVPLEAPFAVVAGAYAALVCDAARRRLAAGALAVGAPAEAFWARPLLPAAPVVPSVPVARVPALALLAVACVADTA